MIIILFFSAAGITFSGQHYIGLDNTMKFRDVVDVYFDQDISFMLGYGFDRSDIEDTVIGEGLRWLSLELQWNRYSVNLGNDYVGYFSGMFLSLNKDEAVGRDARLWGILLKQEGILSSDFFIGEMRAGTYVDSGPMVAGGVISFSKGILRVGTGYLRFMVRDDDTLIGAPYKEHFTLFNSYSKEGKEMGVEFMLMRNLGKYDPVLGWVKDEYIGTGGYFYSNLSFSPLSLSLELKHYNGIKSSFTTPPPCTPDGESINQGENEMGGLLGIGFTGDAFESIFKISKSISPSSYLYEVESTTKWYITEDLSLTADLFYKNRSLPYRIDRKLNLIIETFSFSISPILAYITEPLWDENPFFETSIEMGYTPLPLGVTLLIDKSFSEYYKEDFFYKVSIFYRGDNLETSLSYGKTREFLECGSGVCRWVPGFEGITLSIFLRI